MSKMKLTGEYQFTDYGVEIEGRVHDTRIHELREKVAAATSYMPTLYPGDFNEMEGVVSDLSTIKYRIWGPRWFNKMAQLGNLDNEVVNKIMGQKTVQQGLDFSLEFQRAGILSDNGAAMVMYARKIAVREGRRRRYVEVKPTNSGWVFEKVQADGSFKVQLYGLVNRHILTMILGAATRYAKLLDSDLVHQLTDKKENLRNTTSPWGY